MKNGGLYIAGNNSHIRKGTLARLKAVDDLSLWMPEGQR
jgi:hypothetical protein